MRGVQFETPLLREFKTLYSLLLTFGGLEEVDAVVYLRPFLLVLREDDNSFRILCCIRCRVLGSAVLQRQHTIAVGPGWLWSARPPPLS